MTVRAYMTGDPTRIDLSNKIDPESGLRYLGSAWRDPGTGQWLCMADAGALCVVEVWITLDGESPPSHVTPESSPKLHLIKGARLDHGKVGE
jgi:hypothetical protein